VARGRAARDLARRHDLWEAAPDLQETTTNLGALVRKILALAALVGVAALTAPAQAAPPKLIGCNDRNAVIDIESPFADCAPPTP
jgi:hypothetical protein